MNLDAIYAPTPQTSEQLTTLRFPILVWRVYQAIAEGASRQVARALGPQLGVSCEGLTALLERLHGAGLIHIPEVAYEEFQAAAASSPSAPPEPEIRSPASAPAAVEPPASVNFTLRKRLKLPAAPAKEPGPLKLGRLVQLVRERAGGGSLGQLAVYRIFLKIPQELLQSAGIEQLDLDATDLEIGHPQLADALRDKACELLGVPPHELAAFLT